MLQALETLSIFRQNETEFSNFGLIVRQVKSFLNRERLASMKEKPIDSYFASSKAKIVDTISICGSDDALVDGMELN